MAVFGEVSGAPGMRPNLNKVVSFQWLIEVPFWKSGPESGPKTPSKYRCTNVLGS